MVQNFSWKEKLISNMQLVLFILLKSHLKDVKLYTLGLFNNLNFKLNGLI